MGRGREPDNELWHVPSKGEHLYENESDLPEAEFLSPAELPGT